jgi:LysR family cyn operon transcriptional activator
MPPIAPPVTELRHLRYFLALAETGNFSQAAKAVNISQPTLSQQIQQLESLLGVQLFERLGKRSRLTDAGNALRIRAERMFRELADAHTAIGELTALQGGTLRIGMFRQLTLEFFARLSPGFTGNTPSRGIHQ